MRDANPSLPAFGGNIEISLRDLVTPLFRRKKLIGASFAAVFATTILAALLYGSFYSSHMAILVNRERLDPLVSTQQTTPLVTTNSDVTLAEINSEAELLRSHDVLEQVVLSNGLQKRHGFSLLDLLDPRESEPDRVERAVKKLAKTLKIEPVPESNIIRVSYSSNNPKLAYNVLKSLGDAYLAKHVAVHRTAGSYQFFTQETQKYSDELNSAEDALRHFEKQHMLADPDDQLSNLAQQLATSVGTLHQVEESIAADEERIREDNLQLGKTPQRTVTQQATASNDKLIDDMSSALLAAETKRLQLALKYDDSYPLVKEADQEITRDKAALDQAETKKYVAQTTDRDPTFELLREDLARSRADLAAQRATRIVAQRSIASIQKQMVELDQLALSQHDLQRETKTAESNYLLYLGKREQERASDAMDVTRIANVAIAVPPAIPVLPVFGWPLTVLLAFSGAVVLALSAGYIVDYLDSSFHNPTAVSDALGIPVVIAMPKRVA